ncbi:MAG: FKBP-type peptidyl-prolyl cis-trans isomerase [Crocinitomicaceae bacterium]
MIKSISIYTTFLIVLASCVQKEDKTEDNLKAANNKKETKKVSTDTSSFGDSKENLKSFEKGKVVSSKSLSNGIQIKWIHNADGRAIQDGEMVLIEYRLALPDGKIVDGNHRANLPFFPFVVGYNLQTLGWDIAFKELSIGDFAKIELPAAFAYGNKGLGNVIAANSSVWLYVKVYSFVEPGVNENGIKSWLIKDGQTSDLDKTQDKQFFIQMTASTKSTSNVINTYYNNTPMRYIPGQNALVPGLRKVLKNAKVGERYLVLLDAPQAYGKYGFANKVKPNESVLFNVEIDDVRAI